MTTTPERSPTSEAKCETCGMIRVQAPGDPAWLCACGSMRDKTGPGRLPVREATFAPGSMADAIEDAQRALADTPQKYGGHKPSASSDRNDGERVSEEALRSARVTACAYRGTGLTYETADIYVTLIDAELQRLRASRSDVYIAQTEMPQEEKQVLYGNLRALQRRSEPDRSDQGGERVSEPTADASLVDVLALLESFRDGRQRLLDSPYDDYIETRPEAQRQLRILNRALDILRRDKFLNEALSLLGMAATRERTGFDLPGDWIANAHRLLGLPDYDPTKATVGDPHKLISRLYEFHYWVCRSPDHGEFKSLVGTLQTTIQRLRASRSDVSGDVS